MNIKKNLSFHTIQKENLISSINQLGKHEKQFSREVFFCVCFDNKLNQLFLGFFVQTKNGIFYGCSFGNTLTGSIMKCSHYRPFTKIYIYLFIHELKNS